MPWLLELDDDVDAGVAERVSAAVPGLRSVAEEPPAGDLVGVVICHGVSETLTDVLAWASRAGTEALVVTSPGARLDPWALLAAGAADVLVWDDDPRPLRAAIERRREVHRLVGSPHVSGVMLGESPALRRAVRELVTAARFGHGPILVLGETGTGKELAARVVHAVRVAAGTATGRLVVVDCTTIVPTLSGSELFGHEKGAFTGAVSVRTGAFSAADGGTMLLDEVGELPVELQPELLRVVQEGTYKPVGSDAWRRSRFRLVCATHRDLAADVGVGRFRADLYYRIAASTIVLPPLRERRDDIVPLFRHFLAGAWVGEPGESGGLGKADGTPTATVDVTPGVADALRRRDYPGNLRDLRHLAHRVAARHVGPGPVTPGDVPPDDRPARPGLGSAGFVAARPAPPIGGCDGRCGDLSEAVRTAVRDGATLKGLRDQVADLAVDVALEKSDGSVRAAAAALGVTERALHLRRAQRRTQQ